MKVIGSRVHTICGLVLFNIQFTQSLLNSTATKIVSTYLSGLELGV